MCSPGVYQLRDPRSRVFNFDPYLGQIMPVTEFDFESLKDYITSSKDETLRGIATKENKKYIGSSSSMTSALSQFHYLLSAWRPVDPRTVSQSFSDKLRSFTRLLRAPAAMFLRYQDGTYAVDADKEFDAANILMNLGKSMEKQLTLSKDEYERYRRTHENKITPEEEQATPESYHYSTQGDFVMRSQLDAHDPRLPGTGMFDLKTRAVVSIRMDARNFENGVGYEIRGRYGDFESYEREYFDMIRAAFLKYSLQVRIGRMDGIFVAFHNIQRIFGFQYISLPEMDQTIHGQTDTALGDTEFRLSIALWNKVLDRATAKFPRRSLRLHFETRETTTPSMYVFAEPVTEDEIHAIQTKNQAEIDAYQRRILKLGPHPEAQSEPSSSNPEQATPEEAAAESSATDPTSPSTSSSAEQETQETQEEEDDQPTYSTTDAPDTDFIRTLESDIASETNGHESDPNLLAIGIMVKSQINGQIVNRPESLSRDDTWDLEYQFNEMQGPHVRSLYESCKKRRMIALRGGGEDESGAANNAYLRRLKSITDRGRAFRMGEDRLDREEPIVVLDQKDQK